MNGDCLTIERPPIRVLLIEDNEGDADLVREGLDGESSVHFHVDWATTLEAGRERLAQGKTDLVLLDLSLPDSHGMDTFRTIRSLAPQLPVVILTGLDDKELAFQTIHEGGAGLPCQGSGHASVHGQNHSLRCGAQARPGRPAPLGTAVPTPLRDDPLPRSAFSPSTRQPFWPSTRQPSITTGIPRRTLPTESRL